MKILGLLFLLSLPLANAVQFEYSANEGDRFSVVTTVVQDVYKNNNFSHTATLLNRSSHSVLDVLDDIAMIRSRFYLSERKSTMDHSYELDRVYESMYRRSKFGIHSDAEGFFMPVVRDIPSFPEKELYPGDRWIGKGSEMHDFRRSYSIDRPFQIPATVLYEYLEDKVVDGKKYAIFSIKYSVYKDLGAPPVGKKQYPLSVYGTSMQELTWDIELGMPHLVTEDFHYTFRLSDGQKIEHRGKSRSEFRDDGRIDITSLIERLIRDLKDNGFSDPKVERSPDGDGVVIILEGIGFNPNSAELRTEEVELLTNLSTVLKKYPSFDLLITGHTALAGTELGRLTLSKQRARITAEFLINSGARKDTQVMTDGKGATVPRGDNSTPEGMRMNRRVEIKLLTNFGEAVDIDALRKRLEEAQFE
ncbi:MAG: OmpA family protein [Spirochaetales bacterium]|nr:OmpA family protein [Spirochaetales bacterium]